MIGKERSVALFDLDKTIYNEHSFFPLAKFMVDEGLLPEQVWDDIASELGKYKQKLQTYSFTANNLLKIFGMALKGKAYSAVTDKAKEFFSKNKNYFYPYFEQILPELRKTHDIILVTTNSQMVAEAVVGMFNLNGFLCTQFEVIDGKFTGNIISTLADGKQVVGELVAKYNGETMAFGDSENDIGMMEKVKHPICINPSEELLEVAKLRGWAVFSDNTARDGFIKMMANATT